jgi:subtilisin family serine protease
MAEQTGSIIVEQDPFMPLWFVLSVTSASNYNTLKVTNIFYESGLFQSAEPDFMLENILACVNDPYFNDQWGLKNTGQYGGTSGIDIKACDAWQIATGSGIVVAVMDEGIELDHPDLEANIYPLSFDTENRSSPSVVRGAHGTACAGIIGAVQNNDTGVSGVAPAGQLMSISRDLGVFSVLDPLTKEDLAFGINWAWHHGADVISNSWGGTHLQGWYIAEAIDSAQTYGRGGKGCVVVFSAGNDDGALPSGLYFVKIKTESDEVIKKVVKQ